MHPAPHPTFTSGASHPALDASGLDDSLDTARANAFAMLADPVRRAMVERLVNRPCSVGRLAAGFPISRAAISQHLKVLLRAGLVSYRKRGAHNIYTVNPEPLLRLQGYVQELSREARWTASEQRRQAAAFEAA